MNNQNFTNRSSRRRKIQRQRRIIVVMCIIICLVCIVFGTLLAINLLSDTKKPSVESTSSQTASSISAISSDTSTNATSSEPTGPVQIVSTEDRSAMLSTLENDISSFLNTQAGRYSMCYINLENGETLSFEGDSPMVAASSVKIAYNTYLYTKIADGTISLDETMEYNSSPYPQGDYEAGTGTIQNSQNGTEFTIGEITGLSIRISDNCATNMVLRKLNGIDAVNDEFMVPISAVVNYRSSVSYTDYNGAYQSGKHRTSATDLAKYAQELHRLYMENPENYQPLIDDLCNTEYSWGVQSGVPAGTIVAHKIGFNSAYGANNDVAIVFGTEDYILCVMTETDNATTAQNNIAEVSEMVSEYIGACYGN